jgi:hypothetical protein
MIVFTCRSCATKARVADELAGKKVRCPGCMGVNDVPPAAPEPVLEAQIIPEASPAPAPEREAVQRRRSPAPPAPRRDDRERHSPDEEDRRYPPRPARERPAAKRNVMVPLLVVGGVLAFGLVVVVGVAVLYFALRPARAVPVANVAPDVPGVPAEQWQPFSPVGGAYTVSMPGSPVENNTRFPNAAGRHFDLDRPADQLHFTAEHFDTLLRFGLRHVYLEERQEALQTRNGTLLAESDLQLDGVPGMEFRARMPDGMVLISRVYQVRRQRYARCYVISVRYKTREREATMFLDSFRIHKGPDEGGLVLAPPPGKTDQPQPQPQPQPEPEPEKHVVVDGPATTKGERPVWEETGSDRTIALAFSTDNKTLAVGHWGGQPAPVGRAGRQAGGADQVARRVRLDAGE